MARPRRLLPDPGARLGWVAPRLPTVATAADGCTGFSLAFGVFQEYYSSHPESLQGETSNVAIIGTTVTVSPCPSPYLEVSAYAHLCEKGIMYLMSPFSFAILTRWPRLRRWFGPMGLVLAAVGFLASSFATTVWQLVLTQGVLSALGCGLLFTPTTLYLDEWFVRRKGLAYGVMWAGKSFTGVALPFAAEAGLRRFGPEVTLRAWAILTVRAHPFLDSAGLLPFSKCVSSRFVAD